jgi:membrane protease YdiL (CAAX protease family)
LLHYLPLVTYRYYSPIAGSGPSRKQDARSYPAAFQLTYTTLFGWFAAYLFLRTRSVLPPLAAHVYCNIMGIYLPGTAIRRYPSKRTGERGRFSIAHDYPPSLYV